MDRKNRKHKQYTIEGKNEIVKMYLGGQTKGMRSLAKDLGVWNSQVQVWVKQYRMLEDIKKTMTCLGRQKKNTR